MLKNVRAITVDQIKGALRDILLPIFAPKTANLVVTCATVLEDVCSSNGKMTINQRLK
jgi:hypothetical protein